MAFCCNSWDGFFVAKASSTDTVESVFNGRVCDANTAVIGGERIKWTASSIDSPRYWVAAIH